MNHPIFPTFLERMPFYTARLAGCHFLRAFRGLLPNRERCLRTYSVPPPIPAKPLCKRCGRSSRNTMNKKNHCYKTQNKVYFIKDQTYNGEIMKKKISLCIAGLLSASILIAAVCFASCSSSGSSSDEPETPATTTSSTPTQTLPNTAPCDEENEDGNCTKCPQHYILVSGQCVLQQ